MVSMFRSMTLMHSSRFLNKGDLGCTPAYGLNPEAAASCKKIQDNRILKVMDKCREYRFFYAIGRGPHAGSRTIKTN